MATIFIRDLLVQACHGVLPQERTVGNTFRVSLSIDVPGAEAAGLTDDLDLTVNYAEAVAIIKQCMATPRRLLEAAATDIISALRQHFGQSIRGGEITIEKLAPPIPGAQMQSVGVTLRF